MAQLFDRNSNALARAVLLISGLLIVCLALTLNELQRSPWVTRQGQRAPQPVPFSHKHHVQGLGLQCQYCHTTVERSSYAGIPPTKTCMNCHAQIWTDAQLLEPVRQSWVTGNSITWTRVHALPDYVFFNHSVHVNKGIGCSSCHGRVDEMPIMYMANTLQMEWCLNCHRNPSKNLRPTSEIYNMAWEGPTELHPMWCAVRSTNMGTPTAQQVDCRSDDPSAQGVNIASLQMPFENPMPKNPGATGMDFNGSMASDETGGLGIPAANYTKFTTQYALGHFLEQQYQIHTADELSSCETCHR
jgi:hypothetical protein